MYKSEELKLKLPKSEDRRYKVPDSVKLAIRQKWAQTGCSLTSLAKEFGVSMTTVKHAVAPEDTRQYEYQKDYRARHPERVREANKRRTKAKARELRQRRKRLYDAGLLEEK